MRRRSFIVTGTDTDAGKTVFAAALTAALGADYWKPVQAGLDGGGDAGAAVRLGVPQDRILPSAYRLTAPCSPHLAAERDGIEIDEGRLAALPTGARPLVVEGAGGALVPVTRRLLFADLFAAWGQPVILVARTQLGTINHSLLSLEALRARKVPVLGIAFVGAPAEDSEAIIAAAGQVRRLGRLPHLDPLNAASLSRAFGAAFDLKDFQ